MNFSPSFRKDELRRIANTSDNLRKIRQRSFRRRAILTLRISHFRVSDSPLRFPRSRIRRRTVQRVGGRGLRVSTSLNISCPSDLDISIRGSTVARALPVQDAIYAFARYTETIRGPKEHARHSCRLTSLP